jgi:hypothetical protein
MEADRGEFLVHKVGVLVETDEVDSWGFLEARDRGVPQRQVFFLKEDEMDGPCVLGYFLDPLHVGLVEAVFKPQHAVRVLRQVLVAEKRVGDPP